MKNRNLIPLLSIFILLLTNNLFGQQVPEQYVKSNIKQISSIDPNASETQEFQLLEKAIGNARVVMLGEQDHGDANTFLAKRRIIQYLHEKMGFNVLAFESDYFSLNQGWDRQPRDSAKIVSFLRGNIFALWPYCVAAAPLFNTYIPQSQRSARPLEITGFDNQMVLAFSAASMKRLLDSVFKKWELPVTKEANYSQYLASLDSLRLSYGNLKVPASNYKRWQERFQRMRDELGKVLPAQDYWVTVLDNLLSEIVSFQLDENSQLAKRSRDHQMAANLLWLTQHKYANEKIIVWAANYHVARYSDSISPKRHLYTMGHVFSQFADAPKAYILGFNSYSGRAGRLGGKSYNIPAPRKNSFENWIPADWAFAFIDFSSFPDRHNEKGVKFFMKGLGHMSFETNWQHYYDGVFFIREMTSCLQKKSD